MQPAAGLVEARVRRDLGDVDVAVAEEVDGADVVVGVGLQAVALHLPGDVDEGAIKRIAGQREEGDQAQARGHELARLQRTRPPRQQRPALPGVLLIGSSRQRRLAVWTCSEIGRAHAELQSLMRNSYA